jgi:hypothetical protein
VQLVDGRTAFIKRATDATTLDWLRREGAMYDWLSAQGAPYIPELIAFDEDGESPILVLEDLSSAEWPPPWSGAAIEAVLAGLESVAATPAPPFLTPVTGLYFSPEQRWLAVAQDPSQFLALGLTSRRWLDASLPVLVAASERAEVTGSKLLHFDIRSDNLCLRNRAALFVDWSHSTIGNPIVEVAGWLPSLAAEGGPLPEAVPVGIPPEIVAWVAGYFASQAGRPPIPGAPLVRKVQLVQLRAALPWAARRLGLPPPDTV